MFKSNLALDWRKPRTHGIHRQFKEPSTFCDDTVLPFKAQEYCTVLC